MKTYWMRRKHVSMPTALAWMAWKELQQCCTVEEGTEVASLRYQLGLLTWHTTYEAEIAGVILALQLVRNDNTANTVSIRLDNQAAVQALVSRRAKPAHSLLDKVHSLCDAW